MDVDGTGKKQTGQADLVEQIILDDGRLELIFLLQQLAQLGEVQRFTPLPQKTGKNLFGKWFFQFELDTFG